jgi:ABC-2 type transport system ATP-binding protein
MDVEAINRVMRYLTQFDVRALTSAPPTLEDLFLRHYKIQAGVVG